MSTLSIYKEDVILKTIKILKYKKTKIDVSLTPGLDWAINLSQSFPQLLQERWVSFEYIVCLTLNKNMVMKLMQKLNRFNITPIR